MPLEGLTPNLQGHLGRRLFFNGMNGLLPSDTLEGEVQTFFANAFPNPFANLSLSHIASRFLETGKRVDLKPFESRVISPIGGTLPSPQIETFFLNCINLQQCATLHRGGARLNTPLGCNTKKCCCNYGYWESVFMSMPKVGDVQDYLSSLDHLMVSPSQIRDNFKLNKREYHLLRTALPRWARSGKIDNPSLGWYRSLPVYSDVEEFIKNIPAEDIKFHNFQLVGTFPKSIREKAKIGAWGVSATFFQSGTKTFPLQFGGECRITRYSNGKIIYQTVNSKKPWDLPRVMQFLGWVEASLLPFEFWNCSMRIKQVDVHIDKANIIIAPDTAMRIEWMTELLYQVYNKKPLGATRIEVPAKISLTPGNFIDMLLNIRSEKR